MKFASENAAEFGAGWGYGHILLEWPLAPGDNIRGAWWRGGGTTVAPRTTFTRSGNLLHQRIGIFGLCPHRHTHGQHSPGAGYSVGLTHLKAGKSHTTPHTPPCISHVSLFGQRIFRSGRNVLLCLFGAFKYEIYSSHSGLMFGNGQQITLQAFTMATGELSRPGP